MVAVAIFVRFAPLAVGNVAGNLASGTVPLVRFDADNAVKSTCWVTDELDSRASAKVPLEIADVGMPVTFAPLKLYLLFLH